ncbi:MAG: hypothetical protein ABH842_01765 [Candidatus Micrarchaeota archaeon]
MKLIIAGLIFLFLFFGCILPEWDVQKRNATNNTISVAPYDSDLPPPLPGEEQEITSNSGPPALPQ